VVIAFLSIIKSRMKKYFIIILFTPLFTKAQNTFRAIIKDIKTKDTLAGASAYIDKLKFGATGNNKGQLTISNIPNGEFEIEFSYTGYVKKRKEFKFPLIKSNEVFEIDLEQTSGELGEVVVSTTRSTRSIKDIPTKVDVLAAEDLDEKGEMKPADIKLLFNETTGVSTQQTSAVSGATNIRIQGLDGQYTQLLKDGMPLYQGFSGGLGILQIAPIDLKQVEFVKGSASTLYGGGAIAGLVNLISKTPKEKRELTFLLNGTSAKGFDGSGFYSQKWKKVGTTIFGSYNSNAPYDPANIGLTAIPKINRFTINPKIFLYFNKKTTAWFGVNTTYEDRFGGDLKVSEGKADSTHQFFEHNKTFRLSTQLSFTHKINSESSINFKNSVGFFNRKILQPNESFHGQQVSSFSEINYAHTREKSEWIAGLNLWTNNFKSLDTSNLNYNLTTAGAFAQNTFKATDWFTLETGLRIDYNYPPTNDKLRGIFILPKVNALFKINNHWTSRIGGGFGYRMPSPFSDEAEKEGYNNIKPISFGKIKAEKSYGGNADVIFRTSIGEVAFSIDQFFFYTYLNKPLVLQNNSFVNANGFIDTKGGETNLKFALDELNLYAGYTYTNTRQYFNGQNYWQPLTPKHLLYLDFAYEDEGNFRTGIEADYSSQQILSDGTKGRGYIICSFLFEKMWRRLNVYINAENFTDRRQTRWDKIYKGTITNPIFGDIYAPLDGVVISAGLKIKL
jgi:outer membrane receptor for ferrienterochelin and colicins